MIATPIALRLFAALNLSLALCTAACGEGFASTPPACNEWPEGMSCDTSPQLCSLPLERVHGEDDAPRRLLFIAEGYTPQELHYFRTDVENLVEGAIAEEHGILGRRPELFRVDLLAAASVANDVGNSFGVTPMKGCLGSTDVLGRELVNVPGELVEAAREAHGLGPLDVVVTLFNTRVGTANARRPDPGYRGQLAFEPGESDRWTTLPGSGARVTMLFSDGPGVLDHELAHALVGLGDEYSGEDSCFTPFAGFSSEPGGLTGTPNLSLEGEGAKWAELVEGADEGGTGVDQCVFHPPGACRMKDSLRDAYCPVCDHAIEAYLDAIDDGNDGSPRCAIEIRTDPEAITEDVFVHLVVADHDVPTTAVLFAGDEQVLVGTNDVSIDARYSWYVPRSRIPEAGLTVSAFCADAEGRVDDSQLVLKLAE